jgi:L-cysteine:1D-myo-inositol 2-amino-2-deoxy-alpha-D-glucopyranoside ligase
MIGLCGEKMSKSKGNLVFVSSLLAAGIDPFVIRWSLMGHHYRVDRMWNDETLAEAIVQVERLRKALALKEVAPTTELIKHVLDSLSNDLDTVSVVKAINEWSDQTLKGSFGGSSEQLKTVLRSLLGL